MVLRLLISLKIILVFASTARAFTPVGRGSLSHRSALCSVQPSKNAGDQGRANMPDRSDFLAIVGSLVTGTVVSGMKPAEAAVTANPSSSIYLSDEIKTIDLSLPSYDSVNTLKTNEKALGFEDIPESKQSQPKKESSGDSGGMSSLLPSMNKSGPSNKAKPAKVAKKPVEKAKKAVKEEPKAEYETMDMSLPSYSEGTAAKERSVFAL